MKKNKYLLLKVFIAIFIITLCVFIAKTPVEMLLKLRGDISNSNATGVYYDDFSNLNKVDSDYSYSNINYISGTKIYANITPNDSGEPKQSFVKVQTNKIDGNVGTPYIELYGSGSKAQIIIENCGYQKTRGYLSAVLEVENVERWNQAGDSNYRTEFSIDDLLINQGVYLGQTDPYANNTYYEEKIVVERPMTFYLKTYYGVAKLKVTYYNNLVLINKRNGYYTDMMDQEQVAGTVSYAEVDTTGSEVATDITKVNSLYTDMDIVSNSRFMTKKDYGDPNNYMFYSKEGLAPMNGSSTIYYDTDGYSKTYAVDIPGHADRDYKVQLSPYTDSIKNIHGIYVEHDDFDGWIEDGEWILPGEGNDTGLHGAWSGDSVAILTSDLAGEYEMIYGGANNGMWINFMSPQQYSSTLPEKSVSSTTSPTLTKDTVYFNVKYSLPYTYPSDKYVNELKFYLSYPNDYSAVNDISNVVFEDQIDSALTILTDQIKVLNRYAYVTSNFDIDVTNNKVTVSIKPGKMDFLYKQSYVTVSIPVVKNEALTEATTYTNNADVILTRGNNTSRETSNRATVTIESPYVYYDCASNGGATSQTVYYNPGDTIDMTKTCEKYNATFIGWSRDQEGTDIVNSTNIGPMGRTNQILYGIYQDNEDPEEKNFLTVVTENQTKVYDGKVLEADNGCDLYPSTATNEGLKEGHHLVCQNRGSITNVGWETKIIHSVKVYDSNNQDVTDEYYISRINGVLTVNPKVISISISPQIKEYDGTILSPDTKCEPDDIISGHKISCLNKSTYLPTGEMGIINAETARKWVEEVYIVDEHDANVTSNYSFDIDEIDDSYLQITPKQITVKTVPQSKVYDGTPLVATSNDCDSTGRIATDRIECVNSGSITDVSVAPKTIGQVTIYNSNNEDVSTNYIVSKEHSTLTITPKSIVVKATNQTKTYDGTPLNADATCELEDGELLEGETLSCINSGTITNVGDANKVLNEVIIKNSNNEPVTDNYSITMHNGKLFVTPKEVLVTPTNQIKTYDGLPLNANPLCNSVGLLSGHIATCVNEGTITNVGTTNKTIQSVLIEGQNGEDVSSNYTVTERTGTLTVIKRPITVKAKNQEKIYDRTPLDADNTCEITSGTLTSENDTFTCVSSGSITEVGTEPKVLNTVTIKNESGSVITDNFEITKENGTLLVMPLHNIITLDNNGGSTTGTKEIYEVCDDAIYLTKAFNKKMTSTENNILLPTRPGYTFEGYYSSLDKDGKLVINREGFITGYLTPDACVDRTIYAKWKIKEFTLTVIPNNGEKNEQYTLKYNEEKTIKDPKKDLYDFDGWILIGKGSKYENNTFTMGYEDAILEAKYVCSSRIVSDKYNINESKKVIYIDKDEPIENISKNIKSCCKFEVTDTEIQVNCEGKKSTYRINRYWNAKTGVLISRISLIVSLLLLVTAILIIAKQKTNKLEILQGQINKD